MGIGSVGRVTCEYHINSIYNVSWPSCHTNTNDLDTGPKLHKKDLMRGAGKLEGRQWSMLLVPASATHIRQ